MNFTAQKGVTLIELLIVLSVMAVLLAVAVPSFSRQVEDVRIRTLANKMKQSFELARSKAIHLRSNILVAASNQSPLPASTDPLPSPEWKYGWTVVCEDCSTIGGNETFDSATAIPASIKNKFNVGQATVFEFSADGLLKEARDAKGDATSVTQWSFQFCPSSQNRPGYVVQINAIGNVTVSEDSSCVITS